MYRLFTPACTGATVFTMERKWATWYRIYTSLTQIEVIHNQLSLGKLLIYLVRASQSLPSSTDFFLASRTCLMNTEKVADKKTETQKIQRHELAGS